ncbi:hypothetical protein [Polymorphospora sp. NPDC050346]|uniref:hypothetical protein n=1 Tax=Polymorphospora sp. NPDC050346 TaxID=3155780 RepID=UPI0033E1C83E
MSHTDPHDLALTLPNTARGRSIHAKITTNPATGAVRYQLTGPHLSGSLSVTAVAWTETHYPDRIRLDLGHETQHGTIVDRPTVYGTEADGYHHLTITEIPDLTRAHLNPHRRDDHRPLSSRAAEYLAAAAKAILTHWAALPHRDALILAAARHYAPRRLAHLQQRTIDPLKAQLADLTAQLHAAEELAAALCALTAPATL